MTALQCVGKGYAPSFLCRPAPHDPSVALSPLIRRTNSNFTQPYALLPCCPVGLVSPYACLLSCLPHAGAARHAARQCAVRDDVVVCRLTLQLPNRRLPLPTVLINRTILFPFPLRFCRFIVRRAEADGMLSPSFLLRVALPHNPSFIYLP